MKPIHILAVLAITLGMVALAARYTNSDTTTYADDYAAEEADADHATYTDETITPTEENDMTITNTDPDFPDTPES